MDKQKEQFTDYVESTQEGTVQSNANQEIADSERIVDEQNRMKDKENMRK
jgi:hypothetical protein